MNDNYLVKNEVFLSNKELDIYRKYIESENLTVAPSKATAFFSLFLQGYSCDEISRMNPGFDIGLILKTRVDQSWDQRRLEHIQHLLNDVRNIVQSTQLEAIRFVSESLTVFRKMASEKFQKYLQTGNVKDLGEFKNMSFKVYKDLLEMLLRLTGQDTLQRVQGCVEHKHTLESSTESVENKPMTANEADDFMKNLNLSGFKND